MLWQQQILARVAIEEKADVVWGPHGTLPLGLRVPSVATLHDLTSITMPRLHRLKTIVAFNPFIGRSLSKANAIAAVSKATADEAIRGFGIPHDRIVIVPNGVDDYFAPGDDDEEMPEALRGGVPYVLFVGTIEPRKGIDDLIDAWERLSPRPLLCLCGPDGWKSEPLLARIARTSGVVRLPGGWVSRPLLRTLYRNAMTFVYPSHFEGFGIPPLEAMACGAPVIATRTGAIPEYGEGVVALINAGDRESLLREMERLQADAGARMSMGSAGVERAGSYRWGRSAALMDEMFKRVAR